MKTTKLMGRLTIVIIYALITLILIVLVRLSPEALADTEAYKAEVSTSVIGTEEPIENFYKNIELTIDNDSKGNLELLKKLHKKAYAYCSPTYYFETLYTSTNSNNISLKTYVSNGNFRCEERHDGKLEYLTIYDKEKDIDYHYNVSKDYVEINKNVTSLGYNYDNVTLGCFFGIFNSCSNCKFEEAEYNGKPVYISIYKLDNVSIETCFDKETGVELYRIQKIGEEEDKTEYIVMPNQTFDKELFVFKK